MTKIQARNRKANKSGQQPVVNAAPAQSLNLDHSVALYDSPAIGSGPFVMGLPEGLQAYDNKIVNIVVYPAGSEKPCLAKMTGYGVSYMAKVMAGTNRAKEQLLNGYVNGDKMNGWFVQIMVTSVTKLSADAEDKFLGQALNSLPENLHKEFANVPIHTEFGDAPQLAGWVR